MQSLNAGFRWAFAAICFALLVACGGGSDNPPAHYLLQRMAVGETRVIPEERLSLTMTGVSDSRCPAAATCITAGFVAADVLVRVEGVGEQLLTVTLGAGPRDAQATYGDLHFTLTGVDPYPVSGPLPQNQYRADLNVARS